VQDILLEKVCLMGLETPMRESLLGSEAVFHSEPMRELMRRVKRVAQTTASVLITGESGSGKELIARAVHAYSLRCNKPWVDVNCAALPEHLIESELFGYEKGAFSGADGQKPGLFELANGGTIFLDEIGELPARMQVKLLRVLDGVPYYRLGGTRKVMVDVRVVAATNQDLHAAITAGNFRMDLFHRLAQLHLQVPPLRERRADIVPIAEFILETSAPDFRLSDEAARSMENYDWPGNIRELKNALTKAAILCDDGVIDVEHLPEEVQGEIVHVDASDTEHGRLDDLERDAIMNALKSTAGHHQNAASLLGISRRTLTRKLKRYLIQ
jgi:transcriptional regulator with PAS, ATPase and Fis domain